MTELVTIDGQTYDIQASLDAIDRHDCEESLYEFLRQAWKWVDPSPFIDGWPIEAVAEHLQAVCDGDIRRLIINIPPRCSKSTVTSVAFPAWVWAQSHNSPTSGPGVQFLHASYAQQLSLRDSVKCRRLIESPWYQRLWGKRFQLVGDQNTKTRFDNNRSGSRLSTSVGSALTGEGGNCFPEWTKVSTPNGDIPIKDIKTGDIVYAFNHSRLGVVEKSVLATKVQKSSALCKLYTAAGKSVECTTDHPIYVNGFGYFRAHDLSIGDRVLIRKEYGKEALLAAKELWPCESDKIVRIEISQIQETDVYDIQVEGCRNFFADGVLVHNCIIVDDPNAAQEAFSEATIEATIEWWDTALSTRLNDPRNGAYVIIQQRLSEEDLTGHILSKDTGEWTHLMLPMRYEPDRASIIYPNKIGWVDPREETGQLLWPERFGEEEVGVLERQLGPWASAGQLQQRPEPKGGGIIKRDWWQLWEHDRYPNMDMIIATLDTAYTTKTSNDYSAMSVWGVFSGDVVAQNSKVDSDKTDRVYRQSHPRVMLMDAWQERLELHDLVKKVLESMKRMKCDRLLIENKAAGHSVAQEIRRLYGHENFAVQLVDPKSQDKLSRLYSVQHLFAEGLVYAPDRSWSDLLITQVSQFPKGKHDDMVDTVSMALRHLRDIGVLVRGEEWVAGVEEGMQHRGNNNTPLYPA